PNFAVVCSFLEKYESLLSLPEISFDNLEKWITEQRPMCHTMKDLLMGLLKRWKSSVNDERFSRYLVKFCQTYSLEDASQLEKLGFEKCDINLKLRLMKALMEQQFDTNMKFKDKLDGMPPDLLRVQPIGRDIYGRKYWSFMDKDMNLRVFCKAASDDD
ncbi:hypothetical protein HELRODRAFT_134872, partial [Helobdella robusta]|uniref:Uncharacterized protein n=1 Tax=Helobdella robusta TaxID=6412 RepID=T1EI62_HELRO